LNLKGECIYSERQAFASAAPDNAIPAIKKTVDSAIKSCNRKRNQLLGAGIVMPGPFGVSGLSALGGANLPNWDGIDIQAAFEKELGCPVIIENDATAAAIAERVTGAATTIDTFCFVYFGTGLGLGVIADGHAQRGAFGNFGEIGHIITQTGGNQCACGNRGCLETYASRMSVKAHLEKSGLEFQDGSALAQLLNDGNPDLLEWIETAARHLSQAISILENIFDPETIILGGAMPDAVMDTLIANLELPKGSLANRNDRNFARVLRGSSGRFTAAIGGAAMVIHKTTTPSMALFS
ncbi:MAG: ROK family protein, partial [Amylibacter sp.]